MKIEPTADRGHLNADLNARRTSDLLAVFRLELPPYLEANYTAPIQKYAIDPSLDLWPEAYNQCQPLVVKRLANLKWGGQFVMAKLTDGRHLALLPLVTQQWMAWLRGDADGLLLEVDHWGTDGIQIEQAPLLAWAVAEHPYEAVDLVWEEAAHIPAVATHLGLRREKKYPEIFQYLGWCTWEEFKWNINEELLIRAFEELATSSAPVRWVLIDDGHLDEIGGFPPGSTAPLADEGEVPSGENLRRLRSLGVYAPHFPNGWEPVMRAARQHGFSWVGIWLNFNGYWGGIAAKNNTLGDLNRALVELAPGTLQPRPDPASAHAFYDALVQAQQAAGFDFIKVDNQAKNVTFYQGRTPNAVTGSSCNHTALDESAADRMQGIINCMAHNNICLFHNKHSAVTRCSEDYKKGDLWRAKHHLSNSFSNMLWMRGTVWGDHDMFHSNDPVAGEVMARSKAISGGPVYLSDAPANIKTDLVAQLCLANGRLLRVAEPALPAPESIFINSYKDPRAFRTLAPINTTAAVVIAYNITAPEILVQGSVYHADYGHAMRLLPSHVPPAEELLAFRWNTKETRLLHSGEEWTFDIPGFGDEMFWLTEVRHGWAVLGRADKFLGPAAVTNLETTAMEANFHLLERGPLLVWSPTGCPEGPDAPGAKEISPNLWLLDYSIAGSCHIKLHRSTYESIKTSDRQTGKDSPTR